MRTNPEPASAVPSDTWSWNEAGWLLGARQCPSPNFGPRPAGTAVDLLIVHSISLPPGQYGGNEVCQLFTNQLDWSAHPYFESIRGIEVSAHFLIRRTGEVVQFVSVHDRAWHAGASTWGGRSNCNDFSIGVELEGLEGETFESAQYTSLARLGEALKAICPISAIAGHEHVAPGRKQDPGPGFEWPRLQQMLGWANQCFPDTTLTAGSKSDDLA